MKKEESSKNRFLLLYASQTGQAKAIAEEIADEAPNFHLQCDLHNLNLTQKRFNIEEEKCVVIVVSTSGDGEAPDDAVKFYRRLSLRTLKRDYLKNVHYAILALGDSNYIRFCNFGCELEKKLVSLSAKCFYSTGYGDDAFGIETAVDPWISNLWPALRKQLRLDTLSRDRQSISIMNELTASNVDENKKCMNHLKNIDTEGLSIDSIPSMLKDVSFENLRMPKVPDSVFQLSFEENSPKELSCHVLNENLVVLLSSPIVNARIIAAKKLTHCSDVKNTLELTLKFEDENVPYVPGDSFGFLCHNSEKEVTDLLKRLNLMDVADKPCSIATCEGVPTKKSPPKHIPPLWSLREIFSSCIEIRAVPKKVLLRVLAEYATDDNDKYCLQLLCSQEGSKLYTDFIRKPSLCILDILNLYKSCIVPAISLLEYLPPLRPRFYSVASSPLVDSSIFTIVFNVVQVEKDFGKYDDRQGVCTGWLNQLSSNCQEFESKQDELEKKLSSLSLKSHQILSIYKRKNNYFHFPSNLEIPIIMVGPGVGAAPFIGFLQHREIQLTANPESKFGETWLFYGCRYEDKDFLYKDELNRLKSSNVLSHLITSFSRSQNQSATRYVYESIRKHSDELTKAINMGGYIYVCGDAKHMAQDVLQAFTDAFRIGLDVTLEEAKTFVDKLQKDHRYLNDVWT